MKLQTSRATSFIFNQNLTGNISHKHKILQKCTTSTNFPTLNLAQFGEKEATTMESGRENNRPLRGMVFRNP